MKKFFICLIFCCTPLSAFSQGHLRIPPIDPKLVCYNPDKIDETLRKDVNFKPEAANGTMTAYCDKKYPTASGAYVRPGIVAVDPKFIPFGSKLAVYHEGKFLGIYDALDSGRLIKGNNRLDLWLGSCRQAKYWGRQPVKVRVIYRNTNKWLYRKGRY